MTTIAIWVAGKPAPQGSKRSVTRGGKTVLVDMSKGLKAWRHAVATTAQAWVTAHPGFEPLGGDTKRPQALHVTVIAVMYQPASRRGEQWHAVTPDVDKILRATLDGITQGGLITDDGRIADAHITAIYQRPGDPTGALVRVQPIDWDHPRIGVALHDVFAIEPAPMTIGGNP